MPNSQNAVGRGTTSSASSALILSDGQQRGSASQSLEVEALITRVVAWKLVLASNNNIAAIDRYLNSFNLMPISKDFLVELL